MTASLLTGHWKRAHPRAQVTHLIRIGRRSRARADSLAGVVARYEVALAERPGDLVLRHDALVARQELARARARALAASEEILVIAKVHRIRPDRLEVVRW